MLTIVINNNPLFSAEKHEMYIIFHPSPFNSVYDWTCLQHMAGPLSPIFFNYVRDKKEIGIKLCESFDMSAGGGKRLSALIRLCLRMNVLWWRFIPSNVPTHNGKRVWQHLKWWNFESLMSQPAATGSPSFTHLQQQKSKQGKSWKRQNVLKKWRLYTNWLSKINEKSCHQQLSPHLFLLLLSVRLIMYGWCMSLAFF